MIKNSLIIPVFNGSRYLPLFWSSLYKSINTSYEIIIIDDASYEDIKVTIPDTYSEFDVSYIRNKKNIGYAASVNKGFGIAKGDFFFLLNTDLILKKDTLNELRKLLSKDPKIGIVGTKLLYPQTNTIQHFGVAFSNTRKFHIYTHSNSENPITQKDIEVQATTFALVSFRKEIYQKIGVLNEKYYNGCEDIDYSLRVKEAGYKIVISSLAIAFHWESQSGTARHISTHDNEARFWTEWGSKLQVDYLDYLFKNISFYFGKNIRNKDRVIIINLSPSVEASNIIDAVIHRSGVTAEILDYRQTTQKEYYLWLPMILPQELVRSNLPIIYIVDEMTQMTQNSYWFSIRKNFQNEDLIIDHYTNIIDLAELEAMSIPTRLKNKQDVS